MGTIAPSFGSSANLTLTALNSLASDSNLLAGWQSLAVNNSSGGITGAPWTDFLISGYLKAGTTPTAGWVEIWAFGSINDTPSYPDVLQTSSPPGAITLTSRSIVSSGLRPIATMINDTTTDHIYPFSCSSLRRAFGGVMPKYWGLWIVHNMVAALDSTIGNHLLSYTGVNFTD